MPTDLETAIATGYGFEGPALIFGAAMEGEQALPQAQVRVPLAMMNRHGLVAGATGTGKTKTLQVLAEQLSEAGVPVFISDIKGDISGLAAPALPNEKLTARAEAIGFADYSPKSFPVEFFTLDRDGKGVRLRASVSSFGPILLAKVLDLNETQQSVLALAFKYADDKQLPLINLADLRALLNHLNSDEGKSEMAEYGGVATATVGVIVRKIVELEQQEADAFFGSPEFEVEHFLRTADGRSRRGQRPGAGGHAGSARAVQHVHDVAAGQPVRVASRGRRHREAEARLLLRRGAPALPRREQDVHGADRAGRAPHPVEGGRRLLRHPFPEGRAGRGARPARQPRAARPARLHAGRPRDGARHRRHLPDHRVLRRRPRS